VRASADTYTVWTVPAETVSRVAWELAARHVVARGWLGVQMQPVSPAIAEALGLKVARGALIAHAKPDAPGAQAGLTAGDVIASINGESVKDNFDAFGKFAALAPGTAIDLGIIRNGTKTTAAALGETPPPPAAREPPLAACKTSRAPPSISA
jgi:serine protease Do